MRGGSEQAGAPTGSNEVSRLLAEWQRMESGSGTRPLHADKLIARLVSRGIERRVGNEN
jgi:hypothetical protein